MNSQRIILNPTASHLASKNPDSIKGTQVWNLAEAREEGLVRKGQRVLAQNDRGAWVLVSV